MIINTSKSLSASELLKAIDFDKPSTGRFVCIKDNKQLFVPTELLLTQLCTVDAKSKLHVSCSAYKSHAILPNFSSTKIVSVELNHLDLGHIRTPQQFFEAICLCLDKSAMPHPSALISTPKTSIAIWIVDAPFEITDLADLFHIEKGLTLALSQFSVCPALRSASRYLPLPLTHSSPIAIVAAGAVKTQSRRRLHHAALKPLSMLDAEHITGNCEALVETACLLFARSMDVAEYPDRYWAWIAAYSTSSAQFVSSAELTSIIRAAAESLENDTWARIKSRPMRYLSDTYEGYETLLLRNFKHQFIKLRDYYPVESLDWMPVVARELGVSSDEVSSQQLRYLSPKGIAPRPQLKARPRFIRPLGRSPLDYIDLPIENAA